MYTAEVHLVTTNGSVNKNYEAAMRYQATKPGLSKHTIQERYGWSALVMDNVNWKAHGASPRKQIKRKTHFTKLVNRILAPGKNVHRRDPLRYQCPVCHNAVEDWNHILKCPHESREVLRAKVVLKMEETSKLLRTKPLLKQVLCDALTGWLHSNSDEYTLLYFSEFCTHGFLHPLPKIHVHS